MSVVDELREAVAWVMDRARHVRIQEDEVERYAEGLEEPPPPELEAATHPLDAPSEALAAFTVTLDAINFGSGWFPTLRKRPGRSGYFTVALGMREEFDRRGAWSAAELARMDGTTMARVLGQEPDHPLMALFAESLRDLGRGVDGPFLELAQGTSAVALAERLAAWDCFADTSEYEGRRVPFLKRAQITAADLALVGVARFEDVGRLTMFADNLVPHVLRVDGILEYADDLAARIDAGEEIAHDSPEEVEIRAAGVHAVELLVAARGGDWTAADADRVLWNRGQEQHYKAVPRHRTRTTAY